MFMPGLAPDALGWGVHLDFARAVRALGHEFLMLTTSPRAGTGSDGVVALQSSRVWSWVGHLLAPVVRTRALLSSSAALAGYLRRHGGSVDLLHVEVAYPTGAAVTLAAVAAGWRGPIVITPMGEDTIIVDSARYGFRRHLVPRVLVAWALRRAAAIRSISPLLDTEIAAIAPTARRRIVPLSVSTHTVTAALDSPERRAERRRSAREAIDAAHGTTDRPLILSLGRLHPFKGIDTLVRAMGTVAGGRLLLVGPSLAVRQQGDTAAALLALAEQSGVADQVEWIGPVEPERSLDILAAADVLVVPSRLESLNKVCVEAAAVGTPFVVTATTGVSAWVPNEGVGLVVPPGDPTALAAALNRVLAGAVPADERARSAFVQRFSPEQVASQVDEMYREALTVRRAHA